MQSEPSDASIILLPPDTGSSGRRVIPFDERWRFALQPPGGGFADAGFNDSDWATVRVPHCWNAFDGQDGGSDYVRGDGWYRNSFFTLDELASRRLYIDFGAANRLTEVWLNGALVGTHLGGYARFRFELTKHVRAGANQIAVRVNNEFNGVIPLGGGFSHFGGIYRHVVLLDVPATHIGLGDHGSPGVYLTTTRLDRSHAEIQVRTLIDSAAGSAAGCDVRATLRAADGTIAASATDSFRRDADRTTTETQFLSVAMPRLWEGIADPYLYRVTVELIRDGAPFDSVEQSWGLRTFAIDPEQGFFLNGRPYSLHGVNRHQDRHDRGYAISRADQIEDFAFIREVGATALRLAHYQHDDFAYELADAAGLVVWAEIPFICEAVAPNPGMPDNAVQQMRELIRQNLNHPSILCWGIGNETLNDHVAVADPLLARLHLVAKEEDPTRYSTYASHHADEDPRNFRSDLVAYNRYYGWYDHHYDDFGPWLDAWHCMHPKRPFAISEYGAGGSIYQHEQNPPLRALTQSTGPWHPEEWQNEYHERAWETLRRRPYLWGTFIWNMFDFAMDHGNEGDMPGRNDKGLVTYDRRVRKDAFFWYKANWTEDPLVYITSRRDTLRLEPLTTVKIYSNCDSVELLLNGRSLGVRASNDRRFIWPDVQLEPGPNRIQVTGRRNGSIRATDWCVWTLAKGAPYRPPPDPVQDKA